MLGNPCNTLTGRFLQNCENVVERGLVFVTAITQRM